MALTEVPPTTVPTVKVVLGSDRRLQIGDFCNGAAHGVNRARQSELLEGVGVGTPEDHLEAVASRRLIDDAADTQSVDRDEAVNVGVIAEQRLDAAEVAEFFLADRADEHQVAHRRDLVRIDGT